MSIAPKCFGSGKKVIDTATYLAAYYYNDDYGNIMRVMEVLSLAVDPTYYNFYEEANAHCVAERISQTRLKTREKLYYQNEKKLIRQLSSWKDSFME